jgi:hypothetical protein
MFKIIRFPSPDNPDNPEFTCCFAENTSRLTVNLNTSPTYLYFCDHVNHKKLLYLHGIRLCILIVSFLHITMETNCSEESSPMILEETETETEQEKSDCQESATTAIESLPSLPQQQQHIETSMKDKEETHLSPINKVDENDDDVVDMDLDLDDLLGSNNTDDVDVHDDDESPLPQQHQEEGQQHVEETTTKKAKKEINQSPVTTKDDNSSSNNNNSEDDNLDLDLLDALLGSDDTDDVDNNNKNNINNLNVKESTVVEGKTAVDTDTDTDEKEEDAVHFSSSVTSEEDKVALELAVLLSDDDDDIEINFEAVDEGDVDEEDNDESHLVVVTDNNTNPTKNSDDDDVVRKLLFKSSKSSEKVMSNIKEKQNNSNRRKQPLWEPKRRTAKKSIDELKKNSSSQSKKTTMIVRNRIKDYSTNMNMNMNQNKKNPKTNATVVNKFNIHIASPSISLGSSMRRSFMSATLSSTRRFGKKLHHLSGGEGEKKKKDRASTTKLLTGSAGRSFMSATDSSTRRVGRNAIDTGEGKKKKKKDVVSKVVVVGSGGTNNRTYSNKRNFGNKKRANNNNNGSSFMSPTFSFTNLVSEKRSTEKGKLEEKESMAKKTIINLTPWRNKNKKLHAPVSPHNKDYSPQTSSPRRSSPSCTSPIFAKTIAFNNKVMTTQMIQKEKLQERENSAKKIIGDCSPRGEDKIKPIPFLHHHHAHLDTSIGGIQQTTPKKNQFVVRDTNLQSKLNSDGSWTKVGFDTDNTITTTTTPIKSISSEKETAGGHNDCSFESHVSLSSQCTVESFVSPTREGIRGCQSKFDPILHRNNKGPCELCVFHLTEKEKEKLDEEGRHLLVQFTTGGCRDCHVFPNHDATNGVRLCHKCHSTSHREMQERLRKKGNDSATIGYSFSKVEFRGN